MTNEERSFLVEGALSGETLTSVIAHFLSCSKKRAKALIDARAVYVNERRVWIASHAVRRGDVISVRSVAESPHASLSDMSPLPVLYEDDDLVVINKPPGILSDGVASVEEALQSRMPGVRAVHRLDRDTTGCLVLAKHHRARIALEEVFRARTIIKRYLAFVAGRLPRATTSVHKPVSGKSAHTHVKVLKYWGDTTLIEVEIKTGRTHQIRRHLASIGYPVLGDPNYGTGRVISAWERGLARQLLHAWSIEFTQPISGATLSLRAPLPRDFPRAAHDITPKGSLSAKRGGTHGRRPSPRGTRRARPKRNNRRAR